MTECLAALDGLAENPAVPMRDRLGIALQVAKERRKLILKALEGHRGCTDFRHLDSEIRRILEAGDDEEASR